MKEKDSGLYAAFCAKDSRFDGRFFVGISSTKIYCRPVCRAKLPKEENCTFFTTAAEAEREGYRPCLLCRPELAPGKSADSGFSSLAFRASKMIEESCGSGEGLRETAERLGCSERHLRRVFEEEFHVSPVQYRQTCRLLLAKNLLTDTNRNITEIAMASGFGSLRRFNEAFRSRYQLTPTDLRKRQGKEKREGTKIKISIGYRPPLLWAELLGFLRDRAIPGVETVTADCYCRTVRLFDGKGAPALGWICVSNKEERSVLEVSLSDSLFPVLTQVMGRVRDLFDLNCDPESVYQGLSSMNEIRRGLCVPGTRLPGCFDPFEMSVRAVLGQQITVKAARTLAGRLVSRFGIPISAPILEFPELTHIFPPPEVFTELGEKIEAALGALGVIKSRSQAIKALAVGTTEGGFLFHQCRDTEEEIKKLTEIRGIGQWTAGYIAMRTMASPDVFLETDAGIRHALPGYSPRELSALAERWRPWRSYGVMNLWNNGLVCTQEGAENDSDSTL